MIAALRKILARFWFGPTDVTGDATILSENEDEDEDEESHRLADETYRCRLREEEDEEDRHNRYEL